MNAIIAVLFSLTGIWKLGCLFASNDGPVVSKKPGSMVQDTIKQVKVTVADTTVSAMIILSIRDTAQTLEDIGRLLNAHYGELFTYVNEQGLQPQKIMAFYHTYQPPYVMDAAVEVDKVPAQVTGRIKLNRMNGGNAVIAHYQGPYERVDTAYNEIGKWLQEKKKTPDGPPFEVYLNDPASVQDPYELRTDVYQMVK